MTSTELYPKNYTKERRAKHFADSILAVMQDYIPSNRDMRDHIHDELYKLAMEANVAIVNVPPECDAMDKMALEHHMLQRSRERVVVWLEDNEPKDKVQG